MCSGVPCCEVAEGPGPESSDCGSQWGQFVSLLRPWHTCLGTCVLAWELGWAESLTHSQRKPSQPHTLVGLLSALLHSPSAKWPPADAGDIRDVGSVPVLGRSPREGQGSQVQYSCLENPMGRGAWQGTVHRVTKCQTRLKQLSTCTPSCCPCPPGFGLFPLWPFSLLLLFFTPFHTAPNIPAHTRSGRWLAAKPLSSTVKKSWVAWVTHHGSNWNWPAKVNSLREALA